MYKSKLQELCHKKAWGEAEYKYEKQGLEHKPSFSATVTLNGLSFTTVDSFRSVKAAQNDAARLAFDHLTAPPQPQPIPFPKSSLFPQPTFLSSSSPALPTRMATDLITTHDTTPQLQNTQEKHEIPQVSGNATGANGRPSGFERGSRDLHHLYKNQLQYYAQKQNLTLPVYSCEREGPPHAFRFKCSVTFNEQTYKGPDFFSTMKDAEDAAAKVALISLFPNGIQEHNSTLYKNLLQELIQKEGFRLPVYCTRTSGEPHHPTFVSTVDIEGESFTGQKSRIKKLAELSAAKVAYNTLRERRSMQIPLSQTLAPHGQEDLELLSSNTHLNLAVDLQQKVRPNASTSSVPSLITREQDKDDSVAMGCSHHPTPVSSGVEGFSSSGIVCGCACKTLPSVLPLSQNGLSSSLLNCSSSSDMDSTLEPQAKRNTPFSNKVYIYPRKANMTCPEGCTVLPLSDDNWVAYSLLK